jgi:hypothetical protein
MSIFHTVRGGVTGAINFVVDQNRKISLISKVKHVIREEEQRANEAYIALGKYYYHHLRNEENNDTEFYCAQVDHAERRLQRAELKLEELTQRESEIYTFDDEAFEEFCRECEESGCDGCEGCRPIFHEDDQWAYGEDGEEENGIDVELPPQVQQAMESQQQVAPEDAPAEEPSEEEPTV